jgi:thiamine biosynthesis lipoprotein
MNAACAATLTRDAEHWMGRFVAMASPCEVLIDDAPASVAQQVLEAVAAEAWRIEHKFSRYRGDSVVQQINASAGSEIAVDDECANLLDFAATLTRLSQGAFDITSGVLRKAWTFDGGECVPSQAQIDALLGSVGWHRIEWRRPVLKLAAGMQIDLGGIGKEYAVDCAAALVRPVSTRCLLNFGGDLLALGPQLGQAPWRVGIESVSNAGAVARHVDLTIGALATSGDSRRFLLKDGKRYSHVLDPRSGWPVVGAPRSVTVAAATCTDAGMLATLALLQGAGAEAFLEAQGAQFWALR